MQPAPPSFFLERELGEEPARLSPEEDRHATRARRLRVGDRITGVDGAGGHWPLVITRMVDGLGLEPVGPPEWDPRPGQEGSRLPWIEVAVAWPRRSRADGMLSRLVQLGAAAVTPLTPANRGAEPVPETPPARWHKVAREALKQSRRTWLPELAGGHDIEALLGAREGAAVAFLDPEGGMSLDTWLRSLVAAPLSLGTSQRPIVLVVGPEGGFDAAERAALLEAGATSSCVGPHVLRIETAAEAAMAVAAAVLCRPRDAHWPKGPRALV